MPMTALTDQAMTLPSLIAATANDTSPSSSDATPGVYAPCSSLNSFLHGESLDPEPNIHRASDVTVSDETSSEVSFTSSDETSSGHIIRPSKVGDFQLQAKDPVTGESLGHITLTDVSALKNSPLNLISVSMLVEQGSRVNFEKGNSYLEWKGKRLPLVEQNGFT